MILLLGASASGKTEIAKYLFRRYQMVKAITHTTRPMRQGERQDVDYHFVSKERFLEMKNADKFVETTLYNDNYYGCSKDECGDDKCIVLDPSGIKNFLALNNPHIVTFFLNASPAVRQKRMESRGDDPASIQKRLIGDCKTFARENLPSVDYELNVDEDSVEALGDKIYSLYKERLAL